MDHRRLTYIDSLRGLAAVGVIFFHLQYIATDGQLTVPAWMVSITNDVFEGGVPLFFAISGFLLTMLMPTYARHTHPIVGFYVKRVFRIAPMFYFTILIWTIWDGNEFPVGILVSNLTFTFNLSEATADSVVFAGWTVGVEMLFYLVFPIINHMVPSIALKVAGLISSLVVADLWDTALVARGEPRYTALNFLHNLPLFFLGMIAFDLMGIFKARSRPRDTAFVLLALSAFAFRTMVNAKTVLVELRYWQGFGCATFLLAFAVHPFALLVNRGMAFVGRISYSMYLLHGFVIVVIMQHVFRAPYKWGLDPAVAYPVACIMALALIIPVSWVTYELIEVPGIRLGSIIVRWLDRRTGDTVWFGGNYLRGLRLSTWARASHGNALLRAVSWLRAGR